MDSSGNLREPLQRSRIVELEARKNALLEEVRRLTEQASE